jgi:transposase
MSIAASYKRSDETKSKMSSSREEKIAKAKGMTLEEWRAYKENAVKYWIDNRESSSVVAKMFKVDKSMLYSWKAQYLEKLNNQE